MGFEIVEYSLAFLLINAGSLLIVEWIVEELRFRFEDWWYGLVLHWIDERIWEGWALWEDEDGNESWRPLDEWDESDECSSIMEDDDE